MIKYTFTPSGIEINGSFCDCPSSIIIHDFGIVVTVPTELTDNDRMTFIDMVSASNDFKNIKQKEQTYLIFQNTLKFTRSMFFGIRASLYYLLDCQQEDIVKLEVAYK